MKFITRCFIFAIFMALSCHLFAQFEPQASPKPLVRNDQFVVFFGQKTLGDKIKKLEVSQVAMVSPKTFTQFVVSKVKLTIEKKTGGPDGPGIHYWEHREMLALIYYSHLDSDPRFEFVLFSGEDVSTTFQEVSGKLPPTLRAINKTLMFDQGDHLQLKDQEKLLEAAKKALAFAKQIIEEAENFDEKKGLPENLTQQIPGYLKFDPAAWGLAPVPQEEEKK